MACSPIPVIDQGCHNVDCTQYHIQMGSMPQLWDSLDGIKTFTVGRGKKHYDIWTVGQCGLHYAYQTLKDGRVGYRRAIEPTKVVTIHIHTKTAFALIDSANDRFGI